MSTVAGPQRQSLRILATDGYALAATEHLPAAEAPSAAVIVNSATGVPARYYRRYASYLASNGFVALTWDYRGTAASRPPKLRGFAASMAIWGGRDLAGAIDWALARYRGLALHVVGHSVGGFLIGMAPNNQRIKSAVTVGTQLAYWPDYQASHRLPMLALWHGLMPLATALMGYFPGRALRIGEDLPAGVVRDWMRRGQKHLVTPERMAGMALPEAYANFDALTMPMLAYSFTDDVFATEAAMARYFLLLRNTLPIHRRLAPHELGVGKIGHLGFFRDTFRDSLWRETVDWLREPRAPARGARTDKLA
jgi:predicted alpha/beta hydrolase